MTFQTSPLINYVYWIVARSRLTDVATTASMGWETPTGSGALLPVLLQELTRFSKCNIQSREVQLHCTTEMRKYELYIYTRTHTYMHTYIYSHVQTQKQITHEHSRMLVYIRHAHTRTQTIHPPIHTCKDKSGKAKVQPRTGYEIPEGSRGIALLFH